MKSFVGVYRGSSPEKIRLIGVTDDPAIVALAAESSASSPHYDKESAEDPCLRAINDARKKALRRIAREAKGRA